MSIFVEATDCFVQAPARDPARNEERYALAMQSNQLCGVRRRSRGGRSYFSETLRQAFGHEADRSASTPAHHRDDSSRRPPAYRAAIVRASKGDTPRFENRFPLSQRGRQLALVPPERASRSGHPDGRAYRIVGAMADVTESRQRDRELESRQGRGRRVLSPGRWRHRADDIE